MRKQFLKTLLAAILLTAGGVSAWANDKTVVKYSFDDALSPSLTPGSRVSFDYDKTSVITSTKFLNAYNNVNGDPGSSTLSLGSTDLSGETWTLSFEWAAVGGCNSKPDHTTLKAGDTTLFDFTGNSNWNTTVTITFTGSDGSKTLPVPGCNKSYRFTAATGNQLNTTDYWHHVVVTGSASGVKMTITNSQSGTAVVEDIVLSETNVNPTSLIIEPCCGGAIGIDELSLSYYVEGEVIQTPTAAYTAVDGVNRTITATCDTEDATLYYSTDGENWTEGAVVTVSESGKIYFKAVKGNSESDVLEFDAVAGEAIVLNAPFINRTSNTSVTITADQTNLLFSPDATIVYEYGSQSGTFTGSLTLTVEEDAVITAFAEFDGYTTSETSERAVALFPTNVKQIENTASKTSGWSANAFNEETITASERTYAALFLDDVQWGSNIYLQTDGAWGLRASGNWYINSDTQESWLLMQNMKQGDIIVVNVTYPASSTVNATYSKYAFGTQHAYEVTEDGNVELAFKKINAATMDYLYGVYSYTALTEAEILLAQLQNAITQATAANVQLNDDDLAAAIEAATQVLNDENATLTSLAAACQNLQTAATDAIRNALTLVIELAGQLSQYTDGLASSVAAAQAVLDKTDATVEELAAALQQFETDFMPVAEEILAQAQAIDTTGKIGVEALTAAISELETALGAESPKVMVVGAAVRNVLLAINGLEDAPVEVTYIVNGDFEGEYSVYTKPNNDRAIYQPEGWTLEYENSDQNDMTALNEDCLAWSNFSGKPQPNNDGFNSYWVRFRWGKSEKLTLSQTVTLPAGDWKLSADAFFNGASGASATIFAADERTAITGNSTWANYFVTFVSDGETPVTIGFNVTQTTTIENIAAFDNFTLVSYDPLADAKAGLQAEVEAAEAVLTVYADFTEGLDAFTEAIETAKAVLENADSPTDVDNATETLKAAVADFMFANQSLYDGVVYVIDAESGKMMAAGHNWGTRGIVNEQGLDLTFASNVDSRTVTIDSKVFESDSKHFLGSNLYMDAIAFGWILLEHGNGFHISNGEQYISTDADDNLVLSDTPHEWLIVSAEDMLEQRMAELARATDENPVDATFLISGPNFNRNDQRNAAWTIVQGLTGSGHSTNISGGNNVNNCAEAYHTDFTISQILEGAPAGMYTLTAQGFYSQAGNTEEDVPYFFISENGAAVPVKTGDESSMEKASESFTAGLYTIEPIEFFHDGESEFQIGVTTKGQNQWVAFDNFRLTYYGGAEEPVMAGDLNGDEEISVSDAVVVVSIINEKIEATATQMKAADVTADGSVDVADVQAIVNLALGIEDEAGAAGARIATDNDYLTIDGQEIGLNNTSRFTAFQMDVTLTEGAVLNGVSLSDRAADMQLDYNRVGQNTYRIVAFSGSRTAISGNEGALLNLDITGNSDMTISKVTFVDAAARSYSVGLGTVTGINALGIDAANADIYTTDGVRNGQLRKGINVVRMANGQVKKVAVK